jgi:hypothetical protein
MADAAEAPAAPRPLTADSRPRHTSSVQRASSARTQQQQHCLPPPMTQQLRPVVAR